MAYSVHPYAPYGSYPPSSYVAYPPPPPSYNGYTRDPYARDLSRSSGGYGSRNYSSYNASSYGGQPQRYDPSSDPTDEFVKYTLVDAPPEEKPTEASEEELFKTITAGINFEKYQNIPVEVRGNNVPSPVQSFYGVGLNDLIETNIGRAKYKDPTPVQKYAIPIGLEGRDLMACAQTGSGKTAAFLLPIFTKLLREPYTERTRNRAQPSFVILAPTRELAIQIHKESLKFSYTSRLRSVVVYGGASFGGQAREVEKGADVVVGTPGRLIDMVDRGKISLSRVKYLCFDEADRMLDMGFEKQIRQIVEQRDMPPSRQRQTIMFSATFPKEIRELAGDFLNDYLFLAVGRVGSTMETITQIIKFVSEADKRSELVKDLKEHPGKTLVFAETKRDTDQLARFLFSQGLPATGIHGDRSQREREAALHAFTTGRISVLVATDVASRGLDIKDINHVVNFELPAGIDSYVHRIGRTGRAGNVGRATSYYNDNYRGLARDLVKVLAEAHQVVPPWLQEAALKPHFKDKRGAFGKNRAKNTREMPYKRPTTNSVSSNNSGRYVNRGGNGNSTGSRIGGW